MYLIRSHCELSRNSYDFPINLIYWLRYNNRIDDLSKGFKDFFFWNWLQIVCLRSEDNKTTQKMGSLHAISHSNHSLTVKTFEWWTTEINITLKSLRLKLQYFWYQFQIYRSFSFRLTYTINLLSYMTFVRQLTHRLYKLIFTCIDASHIKQR